MSTKPVTCPTCKTTNTVYTCNGCGADVTTAEDAVYVMLSTCHSSNPQVRVDWCADCAVKRVPEAFAKGADT